ncbi:harmonin-like isoform X3 [Dermacentor silvarum]|uniref:harmonin-like isoform X3 n=1 Tax=Dermacentor silvarum TaxID=543639 RepID=UPI001898B026|nr:harmonin-like isoform X3 [Dermacentor silvarum]
MKPGRTSPQLIRSSSGESPDQGYLPNKIRMVQLKRRGTAPLGFSIRGGREHGTGVFVSQVSGGSEAHHKGLRVGDQIIRINGYPIDHFIHEEVLALLKAKPNIVLKVKSVGMIPIKDNKRDPLTWKMVEPDPCSSGSDGTHSVSSGSSLDEFVETKVFISGIGGSSLGCSVVKGPPELPGIFVQTVKPHGLAEIAGLEIGDQITEVNGQGFVNVEFSEAIAMLKSFKEMALTVRKGAGLELFPEERLRRINARLCNRNTKGRNGHTTNGNHTIRNRTLYTNGTNGKGSPESFHDTLTNGSLSEMSDRSTSLSSSQSTSPVTNGHTNGTNGLVEYGQKLRSPENGTHHHHHHLYGTNGQHLLLVPKLSLVGAEERQRLEEEKRRLLEKEQLLQLEAEKLAEERRQLEAQKQLQQQQQLQQEHQQQQPQHPRPATMPAAPPAPPQMHVFAELHSVAQQRRLLREKAALNGDAAAARKPGGVRPGLRPDAKPSPDVLIKQKQHEQLMVEFREVHKKMFGSTTAAVAPSERSGSQQSQVDAELRKSAALINAQEAQQAKETMEQARGEQANTVKDDKAAPAAAVGKDVEDKDKAQGENESKGQATAVPPTDQSSVDGIPPEYHSTVSAGPTGPGYVTDYATINLLSTSKKERPIARATHVAKGPAPKPPVPGPGAAKDVPITDSRGPETRPPKSFFGAKPLVTIGSYPDGSNPRPNRFARPANIEIIDADKGTTTLDSAGKSSAARTPSPARTQSPDAPKMTVSINCKAPNRPSLSTRFTTNASPTQPALANLVNDVTEGAVVKTLTFKKDGPLNLILDGGLNSAHDGRIVVAEVREGGMIPVNGEISTGDQILMVDNTRLVNTSLTAARVAIQMPWQAPTMTSG